MVRSRAWVSKGLRADDAPAEGGTGCWSQWIRAVVLLHVHGKSDNCMEIIWEHHGGEKKNTLLCLFLWLPASLWPVCANIMCVWFSAQHPMKLSVLMNMYHYLCLSGCVSHNLPPPQVILISSLSIFQWCGAGFSDRATLLSNSIWEFIRMLQIL